MAETKKRIIQYNEELTPGSDDYLLLDSPTNGTRKILASNVGGSGGGINYSTEEQDTGLKWIDGKSIYQKTFDHLTFTNEFATVDITALSVDKVMKFEGGVYGSSGDFVPFGYGQEVAIYVAEATTMSIVNRFSSSRESGYATIYYTKTTDTV